MNFRLRSNHNLNDSIDECKKTSLIEKVKNHKKEITIGAITTLSVVAIALAIKNKDIIEETIKSAHTKSGLATSIKTRNSVVPNVLKVNSKISPASSPIEAVNVKGHVRNLPEGWNPSASKKKLAREFGYNLNEHQTWVNPHKKLSA